MDCGDHRLSVPGGAVHEERPPGPNGRTQLIEYAIAQYQPLECLAHAGGRHLVVEGPPEILEVAPILVERDRREAHVVVLFEKQRGAFAARIGDAVPVGGSANHGPGHDLGVVLPLQFVEARLEHGKRNAQARGQFQPGQRACKMQRLQHQLRDEVEGEPRLLEVPRGGRHGHERRLNGAHGRGSFSVALRLPAPWQARGSREPPRDRGQSPAPGCTRQPRPRRSPPSATSSRGCSTRTPRGDREPPPAQTGRGHRRPLPSACRIVPSVLRTAGLVGDAYTARYASPRPTCGNPHSRHTRASPSQAAPSRGSSLAAAPKCSLALSRTPWLMYACASVTSDWAVGTPAFPARASARTAEDVSSINAPVVSTLVRICGGAVCVCLQRSRCRD